MADVIRISGFRRPRPLPNTAESINMPDGAPGETRTPDLRFRNELKKLKYIYIIFLLIRDFIITLPLFWDH